MSTVMNKFSCKLEEEFEVFSIIPKEWCQKDPSDHNQAHMVFGTSPCFSKTIHEWQFLEVVGFWGCTPNLDSRILVFFGWTWDSDGEQVDIGSPWDCWTQFCLPGLLQLLSWLQLQGCTYHTHVSYRNSVESLHCTMPCSMRSKYLFLAVWWWTSTLYQCRREINHASRAKCIETISDNRKEVCDIHVEVLEMVIIYWESSLYTYPVS